MVAGGTEGLPPPVTLALFPCPRAGSIRKALQGAGHGKFTAPPVGSETPAESDRPPGLPAPAREASPRP